MLGIKQDALAYELGEDWKQQRISLLEQKENSDTPLLTQISAVPKISMGAIQNFDEEQAVKTNLPISGYIGAIETFFITHISKLVVILKDHRASIKGLTFDKRRN